LTIIVMLTSSRTPRSRRLFHSSLGLALLLGAVLATAPAAAQSRARGDTMPRLDIYGFGQADMITDFRRTDPNWFDVVRPSKLPAGPLDFNANGNFYSSVRQSRLGAKGTLPTSHGDVFAQFEFDMFGVGPDAGQTTIRLRHAYGQWKQIGAGQTNSQFMDVDVFPNILDYWGPNGMLFFRNVQVYWRPVDHGRTQFTLALERPGASGDGGQFADRVQIQNVEPRFPWPDATGNFRYGGSWGYVRLSGIVRDIHWEQIPTDTFDLSGHVTGWGASLSSNLDIKRDVIRLQATYGDGIQNYFNDAPVDVGPEFNVTNLRTPLKGKALPIFGTSIYLDHTWSSALTSAIGWAMVNITNSDAQTADAYHNGQYASANLLWTPVKNVMMGGEFQYSRRENFADDFSFDDYRIQFSFKYSFSQHIGGK
jgi:hypothetical protein